MPSNASFRDRERLMRESTTRMVNMSLYAMAPTSVPAGPGAPRRFAPVLGHWPGKPAYMTGR
jgi:hypothetical protein